MYQPYTTDCTPNGLKVARNALRLRLWNDNVLAHQFLCHPNEKCKDGCDGYMRADDYESRLELIQSDIEKD